MAINAVYKVYDADPNNGGWKVYYFETSADQVGTDGYRQFVTARTKVNNVSFTLDGSNDSASLTLTGANINNAYGSNLHYINQGASLDTGIGNLDTQMYNRVPYSGARASVDLGNYGITAGAFDTKLNTNGIRYHINEDGITYVSSGGDPYQRVSFPNDDLGGTNHELALVEQIPTGDAAWMDYTTSVTQGSSDLITSGAVYTAINNLPTPMQFKGTIGDAGSGATYAWSQLPSASSSEGFTYKVISDHSSAPVCKAGDTIISNGTGWIVVPSGDEPSGTVTNVAMTVPTGLTVSGSPITSSGTLAVSLASGYVIPTQASLDAKVPYTGAQYDLNLDDKALTFADGNVALGTFYVSGYGPGLEVTNASNYVNFTDGTNSATLSFLNVTSSKTFQFPNQGGTIALTSQVPIVTVGNQTTYPSGPSNAKGGDIWIDTTA